MVISEELTPKTTNINLDRLHQLAWTATNKSRVILVALAISINHLKCDVKENISRNILLFRSSLVHSPRVMRLAKAMDLGPANLPVDGPLNISKNGLIIAFPSFKECTWVPFSLFICNSPKKINK